MTESRQGLENTKEGDRLNKTVAGVTTVPLSLLGVGSSTGEGSHDSADK